MADDDNFDIDIYGDDVPDQSYDEHAQAGSENTVQGDGGHDPDTGMYNNEGYVETETDAHIDGESKHTNTEAESQQTGAPSSGAQTQQISSTGTPVQDQFKVPKQAPVQQGVKRKEGADERAVDPNATTAILVSELHWWTNEDDVRGWANQCDCEDEIKEISFNEHKVNGKSKGYA